MPRPIIFFLALGMLTGLPDHGRARSEAPFFAAADSLLELCKDSLRRDLFDLAVDYGEQAVQADPENPECHVWLGHALGSKAQEASFLRKGSLAKKSRQEYERAVELAPDDLSSRLALLNFLLEAPASVGGGVDKAKEQAVAISGIDSLQGHVAMADIHERQEEYSAAEKELLQAAESYPDKVEPLLFLASYYLRRQDFEKTESVCFRAVALDSTRNDAYQFLGTLYMMREDPERSAEALQKALLIDPDDIEARFRLGFAYLQGGAFGKAAGEFHQILERDPSQVLAHYQLGKAVLLSGEDLEKGLTHFESYLARETDPTSTYIPGAHWRMGMIHERLGDTGQAVAAYEKALEINPDFEKAKQALERAKDSAR